MKRAAFCQREVRCGKAYICHECGLCGWHCRCEPASEAVVMTRAWLSWAEVDRLRGELERARAEIQRLNRRTA